MFHADGTYDYRSERCGGSDPGQIVTGLTWEVVDEQVVKIQPPPDMDWFFGKEDELFVRTSDDCRKLFIYDTYPEDNTWSGAALDLALTEYCITEVQGCPSSFSIEACGDFQECPAGDL